MTAKRPTILVHAGPAAKCLPTYLWSHEEASQTVGVPTAGRAPWRKEYPSAQDHAEAMGEYVSAQECGAGEFLRLLTLRAKSDNARVVVVVSESAMRHDPSEGIYSAYAAPVITVDGLRTLARVSGGEVLTAD